MYFRAVKFWKRLRYYGIGFGIGMIFVVMLINNKSCSWLPGNRVLEHVSKSEQWVSSEANCQLACLGWNEDVFFKTFKERRGDIDFGASNPQGNPKIYWVEGHYKGKDFRLKFSLKDSVVRFKKFTGGVFKKCNCKEEDGADIAVQIPSEYVKYRLFEKKDREIRFDSKVRCLMECSNISNKDMASLMAKGKFQLDKSEPNKRPDPEYYFTGKIKGSEIYFVASDADEDRTRITQIGGDLFKDCDCTD